MKELREFWRKSQHDLIFTQATALAYTTLISLVPLLAVAFYLFKAFGGLDKLVDEIQPLIESNLAPAFSDKISTYLDDIITKVHAGAVGILGLLGFIISTVTTLTTIEKTFNMIWGVKRTRKLGARITVYWTLLTIGPLLIAVSVMFGSKASVWLKSDHGAIADGLIYLFSIIPYFASGLLFSALFYFIPNAVVNIRDAVKAGVITGIIFELAKVFYSVYAKRNIGHDACMGPWL
ncbi:MAG: YihY family inner membrane protein [Candidatus Paceibacterales bacterium]